MGEGRVLDVVLDPLKKQKEGKKRVHKSKEEVEEEAKQAKQEAEDNYSPFKDDKFIDEKHWGNPLITLLLTKLCQPARAIAMNETFNGIILIVIIIAGVLVGVQTYDGMEDNELVNSIDFVVLICFCFECLAKIFAEGLAPWRFFVGPEYKWNCFDFVIVVMCIPGVFSGGGGSIALLRLLRLMRLMKLVKKVPQLQMIIMGLIGGLGSIGYILLLLFLVFYLFAIAGIYAFRDNDPWHYGDLPTALLSLFRASTLEDWSDIMYIDIYGCINYAHVYVEPKEYTLTNQIYWCLNDSGARNAALSSIYYLMFVVVSALVMLSLFVGAVTLSMTEAMEDMKKEDEQKTKARMKAKQQKKVEEAKRAAEEEKLKQVASLTPENSEMSRSESSRRLSVQIKQVVGLGNPLEDEAAERARLKKLMWISWEGVDFTDLALDDLKTFANPIRQRYYDLSRKLLWLTENANFNNFITYVIVVAGALVGLQTYPQFEEDVTMSFAEQTSSVRTVMLIDMVILYIFTFEIGAKFVAQDNAPSKVFYSAWNSFDFLIVLGSWTLGGGMITMLRLLRLLRVLKLVKAFPQLQVIVNALIMGLGSIGYIGVILVLVFYVFAILGMIFFKDNDPWHFGTLHVAMLSLFRCSTFEDWTDVMYINMYGCDQYGYSMFTDLCTNPTAWGAVSGVFFMIFVIIGGLVLLTLFIGVVSTSMDEAQENQRQEKELEDAVRDYAAEEKITPQEIELYESVFSLLDLDGGGTIEEEELRVGLMAIGKNPTSEELSEMMRQVDEDESGEIDIAEFVKFMWLMKKEKAAKEEKEGGKEGGKEGEEEEEVMKMVIKEKTEEGEGVGKGKEKTATVAVAPAPDE